MSKNRGAAPTGATTAPTAGDDLPTGPLSAVPGLVRIHGPGRADADDRAAICQSLVVGRSSSCGWSIDDDKLSRRHFEVTRAGGDVWLEDLESRNRTFVDGREVRGRSLLRQGSVLRVGQSVFLYFDDLNALAPPGAQGAPEMAGSVHMPTIFERLEVAVGTGRHILLSGESGTGKELAVEAMHRLLEEGGRPGPLVARNAACYGGEDDAVAGLFGVADWSFTGVGPRSSALAEAEGGTCYLDEIHNLPLRVQRSLLRFSEDGHLSPLGGDNERSVDVRLVLGTNQIVDEAIDAGLLAGDLVARLHRVSLPPLRERKADIPEIVARVACRLLPEELADAVVGALDAPLVERLCLHDFPQGNVRELEDLIAVVGSCLREGRALQEALAFAVDARMPPREDCAEGDGLQGHRSRYERHRSEIVAVFHEVDGNLSRLEDVLKARGIPCSRRWLAIFLDRWGQRPMPRQSRS